MKNLWKELAFYDRPNIILNSQAFKIYVRKYTVEIIDSNHAAIQLSIAKSPFTRLLKGLLIEMKYQKILNTKISKNVGYNF